MKYDNQVAVFAACGSGAGVACAVSHLKQGAKAVLYYDEEARLAPLETLREEEKKRLLTIKIADFSDDKELRRAAETVMKHFGSCDIIVTAITTMPAEPGIAMSEEEYRRVMRTITNGALYTIQPLVPLMKEKKYGRVVLISSLAGRTILPGVAPVYAAANAALGGMARNIGCTMGRYFITANAVAVGPLEDGSYQTGAVKEPEGLLPGRKKGRLSDVAGAVEYFTDPLASWTTGETLDLNGGFFMI